MKKYILALDQGTSSSRAIVYDSAFHMLAVSQMEFTQYFPNDGWVEHDPNEIWNTQYTVAKQAIEKAGVSADEIAGIGITNQRETTVVWNAETGEPVYNAIVWMCRRTADICEDLKNKGYTESIRQKTGLLIDAYFSGTKIKWILDNVEGARELADQGKLRFGTIDCWLLYKLTGGKVHATDATNASRTMLYNIFEEHYDDEILSILDIPKSMLPEVKPSSCEFGLTDPSLFGAPIMVGGMAGDQQSALFGHGCFEKGMAKNTYGTGCFALLNTGSEPLLSKNGLLTTIGIRLKDRLCYALEGSVFNAGSSIKWLRDEMKLISSAAESEEVARSVPDSDGVYMVPAFSGLGAPYWDMYARGVIVGLTRGSSRAHVVRATLESLAYQTSDILKAMEQDCGSALTSLEVDGGACANNLLMQFQADLLSCPVIRPKNIEATALGAAYLAALSCGIVDNLSELSDRIEVERRFDPQMDDEKRNSLLAGWNKAVQRARDWAQD